jgi:hypothetical protein
VELNVTLRRPFESAVDTSIGKVKVWALDHEFPDSPSGVGIVTVAGEPHGKAPAAGAPPYLRVDVDQCRGRWTLTFGWVRDSDALLTVDPKQAVDERRERKKLGIGNVKIRALPSRSPLRSELTEVAAKWAAAHPEEFERDRRAAYLGIFEFCVERLDEVLEEMVSSRKQIGPVVSRAERVHMVTLAARSQTGRAVLAFDAAISAVKEAKRLFARGGVIAGRDN